MTNAVLVYYMYHGKEVGRRYSIHVPRKGDRVKVDFDEKTYYVTRVLWEFPPLDRDSHVDVMLEDIDE